MKLTQESFLGLKRHFLGVLSEPPRLWVLPTPEPRLLYTSRNPLGIGSQGCAVDFGTVESPGRESRILRITNRGADTLTIEVRDLPVWLAARWLQPESRVVHLVSGGANDLELLAEHDIVEVTLYVGSLELLVSDLSGNQWIEKISLRLEVHRPHSLGLFDFHGSAEPAPFDFGVADASVADASGGYVLSFGNLTAVPLMVSFADLPNWLSLEVDGYQRRGPATGRFFERAAPFRAEVRPIRSLQLLGSHKGGLNILTNDARPAFQSTSLEFSVSIETPRASIRAVPPDRVTTTSSEVCSAEVHLENWGQTRARLSFRPSGHALRLLEGPEVPGARSGQPGHATLRVRVTPTQLAVGLHSLWFTLYVESGQPAEITIAIPVKIIDPQQSHPAVVQATKTPRVVPPAITFATFFILFVLLALTMYWLGGRF